jgi:hypothetical protein
MSGWILSTLLLASGVALAQPTGGLRVTVTLADAAQAPVPIAKHALLISDNPPTREPRRVVTAADGSIAVTLAPGSYIVESDRPVAFLGQAYRWTTFVDVEGGRETALALTAQNAESLPLNDADVGPSAAAPVPDPLSRVGKWQAGMVTVWSPTSLASGFVVDARGLVATDRNGVGRATSVEVQLSPTVKVPARVLVADPAQDVAILWVDPGVLTLATPLPLACPAAALPSLAIRAELETITASWRGMGDVIRGEITGFHPRGIATDLRLSFGESGGPVFSGDDETVVGLTAIREDDTAGRFGDVRVVRAGVLCEALSAARSSMSGATPPEPTPLPVEPVHPFPRDSTTAPATSGGSSPPVVSSSDFDIAFVTPPAVLRARERAGWTGGRSVRPPEAEARLGRLTDFGSWAEYFAEAPPVLIVRVTPKLVEGFWKRLAREAARTQGAALPAFRDFKTNFLRMRVSCGGADVAPIHPFVLEHPVDDTRLIREGLYAFDPGALGPHCNGVTLTLWSEQAPKQADTIVIDPKIIDQVWQDFAPYR